MTKHRRGRRGRWARQAAGVGLVAALLLASAACGDKNDVKPGEGGSVRGGPRLKEQPPATDEPPPTIPQE